MVFEYLWQKCIHAHISVTSILSCKPSSTDTIMSSRKTGLCITSQRLEYALVCVSIRAIVSMHRNTSERCIYFANFSKSSILLQNSSVVSLELISQDIILKINGCNWVSKNSLKKKSPPKVVPTKGVNCGPHNSPLAYSDLTCFRENTRSYLAVFVPNIMNHWRCGREVGRSALVEGRGLSVRVCKRAKPFFGGSEHSCLR